MDRRRFLSWVGVGGIATSLPMAIVACSPQEDTATVGDNNTTISDNPPPLNDTLTEDGFVSVGTVTEVEEKGFVTKKANDVIVFKDPSTSQLVALNSLCTHQGCEVKWIAKDGNLYCPCHDSVFDTEGKAIEGQQKKL